jgi:hypothetical protein
MHSCIYYKGWAVALAAAVAEPAAAVGAVAATPPSPSPPLRTYTYTFTTKNPLVTAVQAYNANPTAAIDTYGPIADWDVSAITNI